MNHYVNLDPFLGKSFAAAEDRSLQLNAAFPQIQNRVQKLLQLPRTGLRLTLVGLGDVGGTLLTALKLTGSEIAEIGIYDPYAPLVGRYELELGQVLEHPEPRIVRREPEQLFDCDLFLFAASKGVPPVGSQGDMRMLQFESNRELLKKYAKQAKDSGFSGLFCQISDPVDLLCRCVYLQSNRDETGNYDWNGLLPEQIVGFGLGVMAARARYYAEKMGLDPDQIAVFGPHGAGLVAANDLNHYDEALSLELTRRTVEANHAVRALGFKPYIAPALSSACISILNLVRGKPFYGALSENGVWFGRRCVWGKPFMEALCQPIPAALAARLEQSRAALQAMEPQCRL